MRGGLSVQAQTMSVKAPGQAGILNKGARAGHFHEIEIDFCKRWICLPETFVAAKVWQAGVHTHTCPGGNHQRIRSRYQFGGVQVSVIRISHRSA